MLPPPRSSYLAYTRSCTTTWVWPVALSMWHSPQRHVISVSPTSTRMSPPAHSPDHHAILGAPSACTTSHSKQFPNWHALQYSLTMYQGRPSQLDVQQRRLPCQIVVAATKCSPCEITFFVNCNQVLPLPQPTGHPQPSRRLLPHEGWACLNRFPPTHARKDLSLRR